MQGSGIEPVRADSLWILAKFWQILYSNSPGSQQVCCSPTGKGDVARLNSSAVGVLA